MYPTLPRTSNKLVYHIWTIYSIRSSRIIWTFFLFQICSDHHLNLIYIYYCCFWLFELCYVIMSIICVHCIYMCLHIIVHVYLYNYDKMFIDKLQIVLKSLLTCKIHKSALEYSIIRRYTNVVYYYILMVN